MIKIRPKILIKKLGVGSVKLEVTFKRILLK